LRKSAPEPWAFSFSTSSEQISLTRGRSSSMRRGVKALDTSERLREWSGGSAVTRCWLSALFLWLKYR
jgi:hypothetical protein